MIVKFVDYLKVKKEIEWQLFRLYHTEKCIQSLQEASVNMRNEAETLELRNEGLENILKTRKKEHGKASREVAKIEQDIREVVSISKKKKKLASNSYPHNPLIVFRFLRKSK